MHEMGDPHAIHLLQYWYTYPINVSKAVSMLALQAGGYSMRDVARLALS